MKNVKIVNYSSNLFTSIISLILGVIIFSRPDLVTIAISYVLGTLLIIYGLSKIIYFSYQKGKDDSIATKPCVIGITLIILGFICIFLSGIIEQLIRFIIGAFILVAGINRIIKVFNIEDKKSSQFIAGLIVSLLIIGIGIYVILVSNLIFSSLGFILIIYSIIEIINYVVMAGTTNQNIAEAKATEKKEEVKVLDNEKKTTKKKGKGKKK